MRTASSWTDTGGLQLVLLGVFMIALGVASPSWLSPRPPGWWPVAMAVGVLGGSAAITWLDKWYSRRGPAVRGPRPAEDAWLRGRGTAVGFLVGLLIDGFVLIDSPLSAAALLYGGWSLAYAWPTRRTHGYRLLPGVVALTAGFSPIALRQVSAISDLFVQLDEFLWFNFKMAVFFVTTGAALVLTGVVDHWRLVRDRPTPSVAPGSDDPTARVGDAL